MDDNCWYLYGAALGGCQRKLRGELSSIAEADARAARILSIQRIGEDVCNGVPSAGGL
jgi:hypothetical protein